MARAGRGPSPRRRAPPGPFGGGGAHGPASLRGPSQPFHHRPGQCGHPPGQRVRRPPSPARRAPAAVALTFAQAELERGVATLLPVEVDAVAEEGDGATGRQARQEAEDWADVGHPAAGVPRVERRARARQRREPGRPAGGVGAAPLPASGLPVRRAAGVKS